MFAELDVVALTHNIAECGLSEGTTGTIVQLYKDGKAFAVEFVDDDGYTIALIDLTLKDVRLVWSKTVHSMLPYSSTHPLSETNDEEKYWDSKKYAKPDPVGKFDQPAVWL